MIPAHEALELLREGNRRFASETPERAGRSGHARRSELATRQEPFAVILGCSDSRVPAEIVFDCGLGDLFVIRVAGNIVAPSLIGSVEFAAQRLGTRLVVVLGHTRCGAVAATLESLARPTHDASHNHRSIVDRIRPAVAHLLETAPDLDPETLSRKAGRANVRASAEHLRRDSEVIRDLIRDDGLLIVGAEYDVETGTVEFFDGVPEPDSAAADREARDGSP